MFRYRLVSSGRGIFDGRAALRAFLEDWFSAYEEYEVEADEIVELDNGVTLSVVTQKGRLAGSDGVVDLRYGAIAVWREGQIVLTTNYADIDEARSAAERLAASRGYAMSQNNLELIQRGLDAWKRGEISELDLRSYYHPDVEYLPLRAATEGAYLGIGGITRFCAGHRLQGCRPQSREA